MITKSLDELCDFIRGVTFDKAHASASARADYLPILRAGNISGELDTRNDLVWVPSRNVADEQKLRRDDIAICMSSGSPEVVGKTARVRTDYIGSVGSFCGIIRPKTHDVGAWVTYYFQSDSFRRHRDAIARGANIQNLRFSQFENIQIPMPAQKERITATLEKTDRLRRTRRYVRELSNTLPQSIFLKMFGDPLDNPHKYATKTVDEICDLVRGSSPRPQGDPRYFGGPIARLMIADITRDGAYVCPRIDSLTIKGAKKRAVSGDVGLPSILECDACVHDGFVGFRELSAEYAVAYFYYHLKARQALSLNQATGAIWQNITTDMIKDWVIPLPDERHQEKFVSITRRFERLRAQQREAERQAEHLFQTLLHRAFSDGAS